MSMDADVIVIGAGPAGLSAALALAGQGARVLVGGPRAPASGDRETRTAALFPAAVDLLRDTGVWDALDAVSEPVRAIRIVDDMGRLWRSPEVLFDAREAGLDVLARNVPNGPLVAALEAAATRVASLTRIEAVAAKVEPEADRVRVTFPDGSSAAARLVVAADGRKSLARDAAGITAKSWTYDQVAIAASFRHSRPHGGVSTEFHRPAGPFTVVPLPGLASSLVWLERRAVADELMAADDEAFARAIASRLGGLLGRVTGVGPRISHPMGGLIAARRAGNRVALVGETAHAFPPIGAQGLNLTLRDVADLVSVVGTAFREGRDVGDRDVLEGFERARATDVTARVYGVDLLNRSLIAGPLAGLARGAGLHALKAAPGLKRLAMRQGFGAASGAAGKA